MLLNKYVTVAITLDSRGYCTRGVAESYKLFEWVLVTAYYTFSTTLIIMFELNILMQNIKFILKKSTNMGNLKIKLI